jgi:Protein of unknown function (DUF2550)
MAAPLVFLSVDAVIVVASLASLLLRRRWLLRQPGEFSGALRLSRGQIHGLKPRWTSGYGRWVGTALVWSKGPLLFRNHVVQVDRLFGERRPDELKWLGPAPVALEFEVGSVRIELAARAEDRALVVDRFGNDT